MMEYYDPHDLWHFLSSHGLLFTGLRAISLGEKPGQSDLGHIIQYIFSRLEYCMTT